MLKFRDICKFLRIVSIEQHQRVSFSVYAFCKLDEKYKEYIKIKIPKKKEDYKHFSYYYSDNDPYRIFMEKIKSNKVLFKRLENMSDKTTSEINIADDNMYSSTLSEYEINFGNTILLKSRRNSSFNLKLLLYLSTFSK